MMFCVWRHRILIAPILMSIWVSPIAWADPSAHGAGSGVVVMDNQGRVIKTLQAPPSREELAAKAAEQERLREKARVDAEQARKDKILLDSYTTEAEIDLARNRASQSLAQQMDIARNYSSSLMRRQAELQKHKAELGAKALPPAEEEELGRVQAELAAQNASLGQKKQDLDRIVARYDADKHRWQEIAAKQGIARADAVSAK